MVILILFDAPCIHLLIRKTLGLWVMIYSTVTFGKLIMCLLLKALSMALLNFSLTHLLIFQIISFDFIIVNF